MDHGWLRSDGQGFFPAEVGALLAKLNAFPVARWNFLVLDPPPGGPASGDSAFLDRVCLGLKAAVAPDGQAQCHLTQDPNMAAVVDWARDLPLRQDMPPQPDVLAGMNVTLVKASLPLGSELRSVLRTDPLGSYQELLARLEAQKPVPLVLRDDFLVEPTSGRTLIPMLLRNDPLDATKAAQIQVMVTSECAKAQMCDRVGYLGGHFATLENKRQVMQDLSTVSGAGIGCLVAALVVLLVLRKMRLLVILLPVTVGILAAGAAVILMDGWIHGLTLSFGTGLVGMSTDYGVYTAFHARSPGVWRTNVMGLVTTLVVLVVLAFSAIPVLHQLMVFSGLGLAFSFGTIYLLHRWRPRLLETAPLRLPRLRSRWLAWLTGAACAVGIAGLFTSRYDLNVQRLNYASPKTAALYQWFGKLAKLNSLFVVREQAEAAGILPRLAAERAWADGRGIRLESAAYYVPALPDQQRHLATWFGSDCEFRFAGALDATQRRFFAPFLAGGTAAGAPRPCAQIRPHDLEHGEPPAYVQHLAGGGGWISIFFPGSDAQAAAVRAAFPGAFSLAEVAARFPTAFLAELTWMTPLTLALVALLLAAYYRSLYLAIAAVLPFFAGVGAVVGALAATGKAFNFVTLIALLMLCGLSTDWGIFAVDAHGRPHGESSRTASALLFCCLSSTLGVLPMVFAAHPVLQSLGVPLTIGLVGALLGSIFAVPAFLNLRPRRGSHA